MQRQKHWHQLVLALSCVCLISKFGALAQTPGSAANVTSDPSDNPRISCRVHVVNNTASPTTFSHVQSSLKVVSAADVMDVSVILQVQHPDVAALEVSLSAASSTAASTKVVLKAAAYGATGGPNMVQTIFSDYAPNSFPTAAAEAPYSSVYRPAEPFRSLVAGNNTAAGAGGSKGVWTLAVTDKATGEDLSRRPLKLAGWELWLCGETSGPLFASVAGADGSAGASAFSYDGSAADVSVVKKAVPTPTSVDVDVVIKAGYRAEQVEQDLINKAITKVNAHLAKTLAAKFDALGLKLPGMNPQVAAVLQGAMGDTLKSLQGLPTLMGYQQNDDGTWSLPTSEVVIRGFLDTLVHCYHDLYWCWENTGLRGNFALDFTNSWDSSSSAVAAGWSAAQDEWLRALAKFGEDYPGLDRWADSLVFSVTDLLYSAAAVDAVASVGEAWIDTAIRLAIYASPIRFVVNPRAFIVQTFSVVQQALKTVFTAFQYLPLLVDDDNNNDVEAITEFAQGLVDAAADTMAVLTEGMELRAQGIQEALKSSAGGLAKKAVDLNNQVGQRLGSISPELAALYGSATDPIEAALGELVRSQQDSLTKYFKTQSYQSKLSQELSRSMDLLGDVTVALAKNTAGAFEEAQAALDDILPGPPLEKVLNDLRKNVEGILSDGQKALESLLPITEINEMSQLLNATVTALLDILEESAGQVQGSEGAAAVRANIQALAKSLEGAQQGIAGVVEGVVKGFPGPLLNSTLGVIQRQADRAVNDIEALFEGLTRDFPNLDPKKFVVDLGRTLDQLLTDTLGQMDTFEALASFNDTKALAGAVPDLMEGVSKAVEDARKLADIALPATITGKGRNNKMAQVEQGIGETLKTFADRVNQLATSIPNQPPLADITDSLATRTQQAAKKTSELQPAIVEALNQPTKLAAAAVSDFNDGLVELLQDLESQQKRGKELAALLAEGPLADVARDVNSTLAQVAAGVEGATDALSALLPDLPDIRRDLNALLGPPVAVLDSVLSQAGQAAVTAAEGASRGLVAGLAAGVQGVTRLLVDAQWQLASLLGTAVQASSQLQAAAGGLAAGLEPQLQLLDKNLADLASGIASDFERALEGLAPPTEVLEGLVRPLAAALNDQLGNVTNVLSLGGNGVQGGVNVVLQQLQGVASGLVRAASGALGVPVPELPRLQELLPSQAGTARLAGRGLLEETQAPYIPMETYVLTLPSAANLTTASLTTVNGTAFDAAGFRQQVVSGLQDAVTTYANDFVGSVLGLRGVSEADGAQSVLQNLSKTVREAVVQLQSTASKLPQGPIMQFIMSGDASSLDGLKQLQQGLVKALDGNATAEAITDLFDQAGSTLQALSGPVQSAVGAKSGDVVSQLSGQFSTVAEAAGRMLEGFRANLAAIAGQP